MNHSLLGQPFPRGIVMQTCTRRRLMRTKISLLLLLVLCGFLPVRAATTASLALTGLVTSQEEGPMEGVLVSAKKTGSNITVTVASDQSGRYSFPGNRLEPGQYALRIRAVGYELDGPSSVEISGGKPSTADLKLR